MTGLPLEGLRVADVTTWWAGPYVTNLLANLGAQVIKVEAIQHLDHWRAGGTATLGKREKLWEWSPLWNSVNLDKLDITLDLTRPQGAEVFKRLVKISDIVTENYTPRVMENFGLSYQVLRKIKPELIMISLPAHGTTGPWRDYPGFADPIEEMSGFTQLNGYPDAPKMTNWGLTDSLSGLNGMIAVILAVIARKRTGKGQHIDLSHVEANASLIGDAIVDFSMNKRIQPRRGNRHPYSAPQEYFRCKGDDLWVGITVASDERWKRFCEVIGNPAWTNERRFATGLDRWHNQDELERLVEAWTIKHDHYEVMNILQNAGIAAGVVLTSAELLTDPQYQERGTFQLVDRAIVGPHRYPVPAAPMRLSRVPTPIRRPAPLLGEHNDYVFSELLGMKPDEIQDLADAKTIGTEPVEA